MPAEAEIPAGLSEFGNTTVVQYLHGVVSITVCPKIMQKTYIWLRMHTCASIATDLSDEGLLGLAVHSEEAASVRVIPGGNE